MSDRWCGNEMRTTANGELSLNGLCRLRGQAQALLVPVLLRIISRAHQVQRNIRLVAHHPAVMARLYIKQIPGLHLKNTPVIHGSGGTPRDHDSHVLHIATRLADRLTHMQGPFPARLIGRAPDRHPPDPNQFETSFLERPHFVRLIESLQYYVVHCSPPET